MAIVSAAIASIAAVASAVSAGVGVGAAVAVAAVNVGTLISVVGVGMTVVGAVTGNESLSKIGGYLGMAGGAMGLVGGLAGGAAGAMKNISQAWDDGVGKMFSSTKAVGQAPLGQAGVQPQTAAAPKTYSGQVGANPQPDMATSSTLGPRPQVDKITGVSDFRARPDTLPFGQNPSGVSQTVTPGDMSKFANTAPKAPVAPSAGVAPSSVDPLQFATSQAAKPNVGSSGVLSMADTVKSFPAVGVPSGPVGSPTGGGGTGGVAGFFSGLPDWAKAQVAISGAQGLAGMAGGWFEGAAAEEKLELERMAQEWKMRHEDKNQAFAHKNASYAPTVTFGTMNRGA